MKKRHSEEQIIRILREAKRSGTRRRSARSAGSTTSPSRRSTAGATNTAAWTWPTRDA
jgi:hypothetical protein